MSNSKITDAGKTLMARLQNRGNILNIDKLIFANIPGLDVDTTPLGTERFPNSTYIVYQSSITDHQYVTDDSVVYSALLDESIGDFSFNWIALYSTEQMSVVAVTYVPVQKKWKTTLNRIGNIIIKDFGIQYNDIASLSGIDININPEHSANFYLAEAAGGIVDEKLKLYETVEDANKLIPNHLADTPHIVTPDASTTLKGKIEIATQSEVNTGTDTSRCVTPAGLQVVIDKHINTKNPHQNYKQKPVGTETVYFSHLNIIPPNELVYDGSVLGRERFSELLTYVQANKKIYTEDEWQTDVAKQTFWSNGDGATIFRLPDYRKFGLKSENIDLFSSYTDSPDYQQNTTYTAPEDLLVCGISRGNRKRGAGIGGLVNGTLASYNHSSATNCGGGITMPVKKGDTWLLSCGPSNIQIKTINLNQTLHQKITVTVAY